MDENLKRRLCMAAIAAGTAGALGLFGCSTEPQLVYGPPTDDDSGTMGSEYPEEVYGPPEWFEDEDVEGEDVDDESDDDAETDELDDVDESDDADAEGADETDGE